MRRITLFLFSIALVLSTFSFQTQGLTSAATESTFNPAEETQNEMDEAAFQAEGVRAFGILYEEYLDERLISQTNDELKTDFYQNYAGAYLDDDGALTVFYKSIGEESALKVKARIEEQAGCTVTFAPVLYSYQELLAFQEELHEVTTNWVNEGHEKWYDAIQGVGISQKDNCLFIKLDTLSKKEIERLKNSLSMIPCIFEVSGKTSIQEQTTVNPGNGITNGSSFFSAGFRCQYNGGAGFVTTFHSSTVGTTVSDLSGTTLGNVIVSVHDSYEDFTFVRMHEVYGNTFSLNPLGNSNYTLSTNYVTTALAQNYPVLFAGKKKTYIRSGTVYCYDYSMTPVTSHWILCDYESYSGDSGGCIFTQLNGSYWVIGVHDGVYGNSTNNHAYGTKFSIMKSHYSGLVLY